VKTESAIRRGYVFSEKLEAKLRIAELIMRSLVKLFVKKKTERISRQN